jgi:hypothetical protein
VVQLFAGAIKASGISHLT